MAQLPKPTHPSVLVGTETSDDAGVYALDDQRAIICTADFITPVADDPYRFGQVAAANALSDVFAMGGEALVALALCAFPKELDPEAAQAILAGGQDKVTEAGAVILGGHTVRNDQLFYGLAVTGQVHPKKILRNIGARPGDALVLTKPLGTGLLINGRRKGLGTDEELSAALDSMARLNRGAAQAALRYGAHACTDITGFGFAGHALGMLVGSRVSARINVAALPLLDGARAQIRNGITTAATAPNRAAASPRVRASLDPELEQILFDPQTSGGLLIALDSSRADALVSELRSGDAPHAVRIGEVIAADEPFLEVV